MLSAINSLAELVHRPTSVSYNNVFHFMLLLEINYCYYHNHFTFNINVAVRVYHGYMNTLIF